MKNKEQQSVRNIDYFGTFLEMAKVEERLNQPDIGAQDIPELICLFQDARTVRVKQKISTKVLEIVSEGLKTGEIAINDKLRTE